MTEAIQTYTVSYRIVDNNKIIDNLNVNNFTKNCFCIIFIVDILKDKINGIKINLILENVPIIKNFVYVFSSTIILSTFNNKITIT